MQQIEKSRDRRELRLPAAARRNHDHVPRGLEVGVLDVVEGSVVVRTNRFARDVDADEELNPTMQFIFVLTWDRQLIAIFVGDVLRHDESSPNGVAI